VIVVVTTSLGARALPQVFGLLQPKGQRCLCWSVLLGHGGRVLMKPGKPLTFATLEIGGSSCKLLVFGLPGECGRRLLLLW
jgi:hypothetical protein